MSKRPTMTELGQRIDAHLKRFESDPAINVETSRDPYTPKGQGLRPYYGAWSRYCGGSRLIVCYVSYQGLTNITRADAERYLAKLDAGFIGRHFEALRDK